MKRSLLRTIGGGAAGSAIIATGALGLAYPREAGRGFGIPAEDDAAVAYVRAVGARDVAIGAILLAASLRRKHKALRIAAAAGCAVSLSDFITTRRPIHAAGAAFFAVLALL